MMTTEPPHFGEELQEFLDKRLNANVRRSVEAHLGECPGCRRELDAIAWTKQVVRLMPSTNAPDDLRRRVLSEIRTQRVDVERISHRHTPVGFKAPLFIAFLVLAGLGGVLAYQIRGKPVAVTEMLARDYRAVRSGETKLSVTTDDPGVMSAYFDGAEVPFPVRLIPVGSNGLKLVGGSALDSGAKLRTLVVYRDPDGKVLVSGAFNGGTDALPAGSTLHEHRGIRYHSIYTGGATAVFWQEGPVVRSLASELPLNQLLEIASTQAQP